MPAFLVLLLVVVPLVELAVIIQVGQRLGVGWTILLVVVTGVVGAWLLRHEGRRAWAQFQAAIAEGRWPGDEVTQGALVLFGGALLLTPGFLTDGVGLLLLVAPTRAAISALLRSRIVPHPGRTTRRSRRQGARREPGGLGIEVVEVRREEQDPLPGSGDAGAGRGEDGGDEPDAPR